MKTRTARPTRILTAAAIAALLAVPTAPASAAVAAVDDQPIAITEGSLTWGFKESWRTYIGADSTTVEDGATWTDDGLFEFPLSSGSYDPATETTTLTFDGSVHFTGYCTDICLLDTRYGNLTIEIGPDGNVIRGDWSGRLQEDPGGDIHTATNADLAILEVASVTPETSDATTTWTDIPTVAADDFVTYATGTRLDPATLTYNAPAAPAAPTEQWDTPGTPVYRDAATWTSDKTESNTRIAYPAANGDSVIIVQGATGSVSATPREHTLTPVDPETLEPIGDTLRIAEPASASMLRTAFDPVGNAVFWPSVEGDSVIINRSVWTGSAWQTASIGTLPAGAVALGSAQITSFAWNPVTAQLAVISGIYGTTESPTTLTMFTTDAAGWSHASHPLDLPAELREQYAGAQQVTIPFGVSGVNANLAALPDGTMVLAGGGSVIAGADGAASAIPALHLAVGDGLTVTAIAGSTPADAATPTGHGFASVDTEGRVLLSSATGPFRPITLADGVATAGDEFTLDANGSIYSSPTVAADPVTGLTVASNVFAKKLVVFGGAEIVATHDIPLANGFLPASVTTGPDGSVYLQVRTADGLGGIQRLALVGTVPTVTAQPQATTVDLGAGGDVASFTVAATGTPEPAVQWQQRAVGAVAFSDIAGATDATLTRTVALADNGTEFRAVLSSAAGAAASEPAALTVLAAPIVPPTMPGDAAGAGTDAAGSGVAGSGGQVVGDAASAAPAASSRGALAATGGALTPLPVLALALIATGLVAIRGRRIVTARSGTR